MPRSEISELQKLNLFFPNKKKRPPKVVTWLRIRMRTDGALYLGILFYFELLILLNLRPNTLSRTQSYHDIELIEGIATFIALVKLYFIQYFYSQAKFLPRRNSGYTVPWSAKYVHEQVMRISQNGLFKFT